MSLADSNPKEFTDGEKIHIDVPVKLEFWIRFFSGGRLATAFSEKIDIDMTAVSKMVELVFFLWKCQNSAQILAQAAPVTANTAIAS
jgi:hypothetical protein